MQKERLRKVKKGEERRKRFTGGQNTLLFVFGVSSVFAFLAFH